MRVIIAGSRWIRGYRAVCWAVESSGFDVSQVLSGGAPGVDRLAVRWAREHRIPVRIFYPDWIGLGRRAGPVRNEWMAEEADALIALWDGRSRGTRHMIATARRSGLRLHVARVDRAPLYHPRPAGGGLDDFLAGRQPRPLWAPEPNLFDRLRQRIGL